MEAARLILEKDGPARRLEELPVSLEGFAGSRARAALRAGRQAGRATHDRPGGLARF